MLFRLGLIGYPIAHSLSPWIHERFMETTGTNGSYRIYEMNPEHAFDTIIEQLRSLELHGFNVTVPYKEKIIPFLDEIDAGAAKIGAVNTVVIRNNKWIGYNTDGIGYIRALQSKFPELFHAADRSALILGAGGAARGIFTALDEAGFKRIDLANRTKEHALAICEYRKCGSQVLSFAAAKDCLGDYDVVIQTTSVGMKPDVSRSIFTKDDYSPIPIYSDIIYQPIQTKFLQLAKQSGAQVHYGHTMLLYQAQYAFEIWTGHKPNIGQMEEELEQILKGR